MADCPTPDKHPYPSERSAKQGRRTLLRNRKAGHGRLHAYPCPAGGHWHVGHINPGSYREKRPKS